jgi:AcrR family transcriptional regulator
LTRKYNQGLRAEKSTATRTKILAATRTLLPEADQLNVEEIARRAGVAVPTLYSHFGSKGGLLSALTDHISREAGLFAGFDRVWASQDGEAALRTMLDTTLDFWRHAWTFIQFGLRVRRADAELGARFDRIDKSRLGHLVVICKRLRDERRLKPGLTPAKAAQLAFALTTPYVYESLVVYGGMPARTARQLIVTVAVESLLRPGSVPIRSKNIDWPKLGLKPPVV